MRDEASLASKQAQRQENELQARERSDASKYRKIVGKFSKGYYKDQEKERKWRLEINRRKMEKEKMAALDTLSTYNYQKSYRQVRKECIPGTSAWICEDPKFRAWMSETLKTLWFSGRCKYTMVPSPLASLR